MREQLVRWLRATAGRARAARGELLRSTFPDLADMTVLDVGGEPGFWRTVGVRPQRVVAVNLWEPPAEVEWVERRIGDACDLPEDLRSGFDLVLSNSVIEHVGGHEPRVRMAEGVRAAGTHYWVQTPNRYFPFEPHFMVPALQYVPTGLRAELLRLSPVATYDDHRTAMANVMRIELLSRAEVEFYFPDARILREKAFGLTKSFIAIR